jgi:hypothetical protein
MIAFSGIFFHGGYAEKVWDVLYSASKKLKFIVLISEVLDIEKVYHTNAIHVLGS